MTSLETQLTMARVVTTLTEAMGPEQRVAAAATLRELPGDESARMFFESVADALEQYDRRLADEGAE